MKTQTLPIRRDLLAAIAAGTKTLDVRVLYRNVRCIHVGDRIEFQASKHLLLKVAVLGIRLYQDFEAMLQNECIKGIAPGWSRVGILNSLRRMYKPEDESLDVIVFEIELVRDRE